MKKLQNSDLYLYTLIHVIAKAEPQNKEARAELKAVQECTSSSRFDWLMILTKFDESDFW